MNELCQVSNSIFLRHEWTTPGPCKRCGEPFPKLAPPLPGDGLYRVTTDRLCAGFVVEQGKVTQCAPILRKRLEYWRTVAVLAAEAEPEAKKVLQGDLFSKKVQTAEPQLGRPVTRLFEK